MKKRAAPENPGLTLALNAAENFLQLAFADAGGRCVYEQSVDATSRGAEMLAPSIQHALALLERKPGDIRTVAAVAGPGGFTGLRLTAATAAGLARTTGARQASLGYMDVLALECLPLWRNAGEGLLCCCTRARRDLVYTQCFTLAPGRPGFSPATAVTALTVASGDAARHIREAAAASGASRVFLAGSGAHENREILLQAFAAGEITAVLLETVRPSAAALLAAALEASYATEDIVPLYVRVSDAEENLPQIAVRLGLDPDEAAAKLRALTSARPEAAEG